MKSEFEVYMETGILGGYIPERAIGYRDDNTITPIYRDTSYHETERGMELRREMIVGGRKFLSVPSSLPQRKRKHLRSRCSKSSTVIWEKVRFEDRHWAGDTVC